MHTRRGFSLVELSIVLVILGLLTGGILAGQSLIRASEMRAVINEYMRYKAAGQTFRDKYFALPGDMTNATSFWGTAGGAGNDATCYNTVGTGTQTCNGNGDGMITTNDGGVTYGEEFRFWQHLANAGLVEGSFTGVAGSAGAINSVIGTNVPKSRMGNGGWSELSTGVVDGTNVTLFPGSYGNTVQVGSQTPSGRTGWPLLKPEEAWNIDTKLDDGKPGTGMIMGDKPTSGNAPLCTTSTDPSVATYNLGDSGIDCRLTFLNFI
jgi:prepilin-type N-terminal cleavage/methylation domain-containing protein